MAQALTVIALRDALTKMGLLAEAIVPIGEIASAGAAGSFPVLKVEMRRERVGFSQLHFLSSAFDTWMISVESAPKGRIVLTIGQRQGPLEL